MTNGGHPGSNCQFHTHSRHGQSITELSSAELALKVKPICRLWPRLLSHFPYEETKPRAEKGLGQDGPMG